MGYSCSDFTGDVLDTLAIDVPEEDLDNPAGQADMALDRIGEMQDLLSECRTVLVKGRIPRGADLSGLLNRLGAVIGPLAKREGA